MSDLLLLLAPIVVPIVLGVVAFVMPKGTRGAFALVATLLQLGLLFLLGTAEHRVDYAWADFGMNASLRWYGFSQFICWAVAGFSVLIALYSAAFMKDRPGSLASPPPPAPAPKGGEGPYYGYLLLSLAFTTGAVLADNLVLMLFFWEGLLGLMFGMIAIGGKDAWKTSVKTVVLVGISDLCMMFGIGLTGYLAGTLTTSEIHLPTGGPATLAFVFLMIGATSKAGSLPFHSWIPDAAIDAPLPFMAFLPAALEKLLGIYFLARITLDLFSLSETSWLSHLLMILGAVTILIAVAMALVQKDYKRLLSYHAISQVGYMILGIGTAIPVGIVGGIFHMVNHAMYKCCLFLTGGAVEKQAGTTDLRKLGGLRVAMPITFWSFVVAACSISGVPPFNGFFSKELVYDGAWERGWYYYAAALLGSFLTAASFLKLGHAVYADNPRKVDLAKIKDPSWLMLTPMLVLVAGCILFGVYNPLPLQHFIQPILGARMEGLDFSGIPHTWGLVGATVVVLGLAFGNHWFGFKRTGMGLKAVDHIHHAPVLHPIYAAAERRWFDPYDLILKGVAGFSWVAWGIDRSIDAVYDIVSVQTARTLTGWIRAAHTGSTAVYVAWSLAGAVVVAVLVGLSF